jgi:hypothetical protein
MGAHFDAARRLARPQHDRDGAASLGVVDVDRQKAALVIVGVEQGQLLMAVRDIAGVVDVENDAGGRAFVRRHPCIDKRVGQMDRVFQRGRILHSRQRRLRTQIAAAFRQSPAGQLECRVGSQKIQIVGILIAASDGVDASPDHVGASMNDARRIATVGKAARQAICDAKPTLGHRQQHHAAIRSQTATVESGRHFLAPDGWKRKRQKIIVGHGERGVAEGRKDRRKQPNPTLYQSFPPCSPAQNRARHE